MSKFKVGDRVAAYDRYGRWTGRISEVCAGGWKYWFVSDNTNKKIFECHEKNLRRLVKKAPEIMWANRFTLSRECPVIDANDEEYKTFVKVRIIK